MKGKTMKKLLALGLGLAVGLTQPGLGYLTATAEGNTETAEEKDAANSFRYTDGDPVQAPALRGSVTNAWKKVGSTCYNGKGDAIPNAKLKGIDVSKHQGTIDWAKVKKTDVDFAIIRVGYGQDIMSQDDPYWLTNAQACEKQGIPYGAYLYSYAKDVKAAESEAVHVLRLVKGRKMNLPIYYDMEDASTIGSDYTAIARAFCSKIEAAGYKVAIYANKDWFTNKLTNTFFNTKDRWVAQYNDIECNYKGKYNMWQSTSTGRVNGISGNVDVNFTIGTSVLAPVTKVSVSKTSAILNKGASLQLTGKVTAPLNATNKSLSWTTSNSKVATVTSAGKVTAIGSGSATITAAAKDGSGVKATCKISVLGSISSGSVSNTTSSNKVPVTSVKLNKSSMTLKSGSSATLSKTVSPSNATNKTVTWKTSSSSIAKVSTAGKVTAAAPGKATITATADGKSAACTVYVAPKATSSMSFTPKTTSTIQLNWKKVSGASGYTIYRYDSKTKKDVAIYTAKSTATSYKFSKVNGSKGSALKAGTSYTFRIAAYKTISSKKYYGSKKSITASTKCKAPTVSKVSRAASTKAKVTWKKVSGATGYVVYYSTKKGSGYKAAKTVSNKTSSYTKTGLKRKKTYYFKVCTYRKAGGKTIYSNYSNVKSIKLK